MQPEQTDLIRDGARLLRAQAARILVNRIGGKVTQDFARLVEDTCAAMTTALSGEVVAKPWCDCEGGYLCGHSPKRPCRCACHAAAAEPDSPILPQSATGRGHGDGHG